MYRGSLVILALLLSGIDFTDFYEEALCLKLLSLYVHTAFVLKSDFRA